MTLDYRRFVLPPTPARALSVSDLTRYLGDLDKHEYAVTVERLGADKVGPVNWNESVPVVADMELPHPPTVNHMYRNTGNGGKALTEKAKQFRREVGQRCLFYKPRPLTGPLWITLYWHPPDNKRRDIDNVIKATFDALEHGGLIENDSQIKRLSIEWRGVIPGGKLIATLRDQPR